ncbi:MAG: ABC transporter permease subunit [Chloroflexi bacterium]|nr:ABC transporter permease subunit [Chloroflexota bacterium]
MRNTLTIAWKETKTYFSSPTAYVVGAVFLALEGYFFVQAVSVPFAEASVRGFISPATFILVLLAPVLTMRLLAEEQKMGTLELLLTSPVKDWEVILGKYLASLVIFVGTLSFTLYYVLLLFWFGDPDIGPMLSGYLGLILYGGAALAVGLLASSLTPNQIVSAVLGFGVLLLLTVTDQAAQVVSGLGAVILEKVSITAHFTDFARGIVDTGNVVYYVTVVFLLLFLTTRYVESRRWR